MSNKGKKANWSVPYVSDRPDDIFDLNLVQEAQLDNIFGIVGKNQAGVAKKKAIVWYDGEDAPTMTDFAGLPNGSLLIAWNIATPAIYVKKANSDPAVIGDWFAAAGSQVT